MADERATPLNQGFDKWLQITDGGKLQTWDGVDSPTPIIGDDPLVTKTELDDKASLLTDRIVGVQNGEVVPIPEDLGFDLPFNVYKVGKNEFATDIDKTDYIIDSDRTYYIDIEGDDSNNGRSEFTPKKSLKNLIQDLNTEGVESATIYIASGDYDYDNSIGGVDIKFDLNLICRDGEARFRKIAQGVTWSLRDGTTNVYEWGGAGSGVEYAVIDKTNLDRFGNPKSLRWLPSSSGVDEEPNSYLYGSTGNLLIHPHDSRVPDSDIVVYISERIWNQTTPINAYFKNIIFEGGSSDGDERSQVRIDHNGESAYYFDDCDFIYCSDSNGIRTNVGAGVVQIYDNCEAYGSRADGFNYNHKTGQPTIIEIDCKGVTNGADTVANSHNGSTGHGNCAIVRVGGVYIDNKDRNVHDIQTCRVWMLGCKAGNATNESLDPYDNSTYVFGRRGEADNTIAYLQNCVSIGGSASDFAVYNNSELFVRNPVGDDVVDVETGATYGTY